MEETDMLNFDIKSGILSDPETNQVYADRPYFYAIKGRKINAQTVSETGLKHRDVIQTATGATIKGFLTAWALH